MSASTLVKPKPPTNYEPTVQDKVQRVLYRLDHGEELVHGNLRINNKFCVLGLFADESGLGRWDKALYRIGDSCSNQILYRQLKEYYNLRSGSGSFIVDNLPEDINAKIKTLYPYHTRSLSLMEINDNVLARHKIDINKLLASIIRSGVIFNKPMNLHPQGDHC